MSKEKNSEIIRIQKKERNFIVVDKGFSEDNRLSYKAKGILLYLLGKPDGWRVIVKDLMNHASDGEKSVYSGLRELKKYGYYRKEPVRDERGQRIIYWESVVYEYPVHTEEKEKKEDPNKTKPRKNSKVSLHSRFRQVENRQVENVFVENGYRNNQSNNQVPSLPKIDLNQSVKESTIDKEIAEVDKVNNDRLTDQNTENFNEYEKTRFALGKTEKEKVSGLNQSHHQIPLGSASNVEAKNIKESSENYTELKKWNSENIETLTRELVQNGGDLSIFASDTPKMHAVISTLFDTSCTSNAQNSHVYGIVKQSVMQILCSGSQTVRINKDNFMLYSDVLAKFSEFMDTSGDTVRFKWLEPFIEQFSQKLPKYEPTVKNRVPYAKAAVLHYLYFEYDDKKHSQSSASPNTDSQPSFNRYYEEFNPCEYNTLLSMCPEYRTETDNARIAELRALLNA